MRCYHGVCGKLNNGLPNISTFQSYIHLPNISTLQSTHELFYMEKENVQMQSRKGPEIEEDHPSLSRRIQCNHNNPCKRDPEVRVEGDVMTYAQLE